MTAKVYLVSATHNRGDKDAEPPELKAVRSYAESRGWPRLASEHYIQASRAGEGLRELLSTMGRGDVLLVQNVAALSDRPSEQEATVRRCLGDGIRLHCLELGPLEQYLPGMMMVWSAAESVERELDQAMADAAVAEERHKEDLENFQESLYQRVMSEGLHFTVGGKANGNGADHSNLGDTIRHKRAKMNLSQRQLAELAGLSSHSQIQRLEQYGKGEGLEAVCKALGLEATPEAA